jgi:hypothetical protein
MSSRSSKTANRTKPLSSRLKHLGAFGGGEEADALTRLAQQAEAEVTAASLNLPARALKLKTDANTAI